MGNCFTGDTTKPNRSKQYQPNSQQQQEEDEPQVDIEDSYEHLGERKAEYKDGNQDYQKSVLNWEEFKIERPNYVNYLCFTEQNQTFLACVEKSLYTFDINKNGKFSLLNERQCFDKVINMCTMLNPEQVIVCSREPTIKIIRYLDKDDQRTLEFKGHEMSVSTVASSPDQKVMSSGSRDCSTRVWDIETQKQLSQRKIDRNVVTFQKWMPSDNNVFVECSEDLSLRLWDIRDKPFKPQIEFKSLTNFATNCDILSQKGSDNYLVTGHRGFNNEGADVNLWDLRIFGKDSVVFNYRQHSYTPESVRFIDNDLIVSASKDAQIHLIDLEGETQDIIKHEESFSTMSVLRKNQYILAADIKANIILYN